MTTKTMSMEQMAKLLNQVCHPDADANATRAFRQKIWSNLGNGGFEGLLTGKGDRSDNERMWMQRWMDENNAALKASKELLEVRSRLRAMTNERDTHQTTILNLMKVNEQLNERMKTMINPEALTADDIAAFVKQQQEQADAARKAADGYKDFALLELERLRAKLAQGPAFDENAFFKGAAREQAKSEQPKPNAGARHPNNLLNGYLTALRGKGWMTVSDIEPLVGASRNTVRKNMDRLVSEGLAEADNNPRQYRVI